MQQTELFKKLLPGILPLLLFVLADWIWGTTRGLIIAIAFGLISLLYIYIREKRIDRFVIIDTLLLVAMGGISLLLDNDIFFKLKPALIETILCVVLGISAFSSKNLLLLMSQRYLQTIEITKLQQEKMQRSVRVLFWITSAHTLLIIYSAYFMSKESWVFISSVLLYILIGLYFGFEWILRLLEQQRFKNEEWFPIVDEEGKVIGQAPRSVCHNKTFLLHPVIHLHVFNNKGELYLQKRAMHKDTQPGKWDTAVGGHLGLNETVETALMRETQEEIGIAGFEPQFISKTIWESAVEKELVFTFVTKYNGMPTPNPDEIDEGRFWPINEIKDQIGKGVFTPNFEKEFEFLVKTLRLK